jgi:nitroreductase
VSQTPVAIIKRAETRYPIHDLLANRWSPRAFADRPIEPALLYRLFEAARWAPSGGNGQPWRFLLAERADSVEFERLLAVLNDGNRHWACHAAALVLVATMTIRPDGKEHRLALYDAGLAVANLVVEATAHGLAVHQMGGYDLESARRVADLPAEATPVVMLALGYAGQPAQLPEDLRARELAPRQRQPLPAQVFRGRFGQPAPLVEPPV